MPPRIGIPVPTSFDLEYNRLNSSAYMDAVRECGGNPVEIQLSMGDAELSVLANGLDGMLLPGSPADVEPKLYGQERIPETAQADQARERVDRTLLEVAYRFSMPVLGICFGTQMLNVFRGGTLIQDVAPMPVNHSAGRSVAVAHTAAIPQATLLGKLISPDEAAADADFWSLPINSSHHQAIGIPGSGLIVAARCPQDGVIEAVEAEDSSTGGHFVLGVQWHPERSFRISASSRRMFGRLIEVAGSWRR